jgi:drug/metabolite transporter (DMT)-like permease
MITHSGIILAVAATVIYNLGFICEKRALGRLPAIEAHRLGHLARTLFTAPAWVAGFAAICCGLMLQALVLSLEPLSVAQPLQASGVVVTIGFARLVLHERLGRAEFTCIGIIAVAVALLSLSAGHGAGGQAGTHAAGAAVAAAAIPACLAVPVIYYLAHRTSGGRHRHRHRVTGVSYGCCAGLVYGFAGVALKALSASIFATPHTSGGLLAAAVASPYLYAVLVSSAVGMCLFQVALQRSPASIIMPISLVISTGYLVVLGSWLFHERLPASPFLLAMRLGGAVAAIAAPVILTILSERGSTRSASPDVVASSPDVVTRAAGAPAACDHRKEERRFLPGQPAGAARREPDEPGHAAAGTARLPDRQAGAAVPGLLRHPVQPAASPQLPHP